MLREKFLAFAFEQQIARAGFDEHPEASPLFDQFLVDQFLIALQNRERIDPIFGRDIAHRRQRIAFVEHAVEYHGDDTIAQLSINRLTVVPFTVHPVFHRASYGDILNYNTDSLASLFLFFFARHFATIRIGQRALLARWRKQAISLNGRSGISALPLYDGVSQGRYGFSGSPRLVAAEVATRYDKTDQSYRALIQSRRHRARSQMNVNRPLQRRGERWAARGHSQLA